MKQQKPLLKKVSIQDEFFGKILHTIETVTVPDVLTKFEHDRGGAIDNFDRVRDGQLGEHAGPEWYDGLTYETMCGISDLLTQRYDLVTDLHMDNYAARIAAAAARDENGYVNTYTQTMEPDHRFGFNGGNQRGQHEIYNPGCLVEAGIHHYISTGKTNLLDTAVKFACYLCRLIGPKPKKNIVPAHSQPEEAMVELYRLFRDDPFIRERYPEGGDGSCFLKLAEFWIEARGHHCGKPDWEHMGYWDAVKFLQECGYGDDRPSWGAYAQDHMPVLEQNSIEGHAVRAVLLFTGLCACAYENNRTDYIDTAKRIWDNMANRRMHASGGVGAIKHDEKFGTDYYLPHEAYLETCAVIGSVFFSHNLYLLTGEAKYMNVLETSLINGVLAGVSLKGNQYSYVNPLISDGTLHRWDWHVCPCCPPMDLKLYGRLPQYIYSTTDDSLTVNLYIASQAELQVGENAVKVRQTSQWPWQGGSKLIFESDAGKEITLRIRLPQWADKVGLAFNGKPVAIEEKDGYVILSGQFKQGDIIDLDFDMPVMVGYAHPAAEDCKDQVMLRRGPVLYCVEQVDNAQGTEIKIDQNADIRSVWERELLGGVVTLEGKDADGNPFRAVPFFRWDNREAGTMRVWLHSNMKPKGQPDWDNQLYYCEKFERE